MIKLGNTEITNIPGIDKVCLGNDVVYESAPPPVIVPIQILKNGDFSNGTTSWSPRNASVMSQSVVDGRMKLERISTTTTNQWGQSNVPYQAGHILYVRFDLEYSGTVNTRINMISAPSDGNGTNAVVISTTTGRYDTLLSQASALTRFTITPGISNGKSCFLDNIFAIDLTETFGAGNEPNITRCRQLFTADYYEYNVPSN